MPTHYHLLVRVKQTSEFLEKSEVFGEAASCAAVSKAMMRLGISYTKAINNRYARVGALFQGQFRGKPVKNYEHLLALCVYIHANPVKDGLAALPEEWEYSNYLKWLGSLAPPATPSRCSYGISSRVLAGTPVPVAQRSGIVPVFLWDPRGTRVAEEHALS